MRKRIAVLMLAVIFCISSVNLPVWAEETADLGTEENGDAINTTSESGNVDDETETDKTQETTDDTDVDASEETTDNTDAGSPEKTTSDPDKGTSSESDITPEESEKSVVPAASEDAISTEGALPEEEQELPEQTEVEKLQERIDALPEEDALADMSGEELGTVYEELCNIYDAVDLLEDTDGLDMARLEAAAGFFTQQIMTLDESGDSTREAAFAEMTINGQTEQYSDQNVFITALTGAKNAAISVKLLQNVEVRGFIPVEEGQTVTFDLNGYTLSTTEEETDRHYYAIHNNGTLTIEDNSEGQKGEIISRGVQNLGQGTMYMKGGTIITCDSNGGGAAIWNEATLEMSGGALKVTGTSYNGNAAACLTVTGSSAKATVTGGTFKSNYSNIFVQDGGNADIQNVTLGASDDYWMAVKVQPASTASLKNVTIHSVNGAGCIEAAGGTVTLEECTFVQEGISSSPYISTAVAVSNGGTVTVKSGNYNSAKFGAYVFNSGGTIHVEGGDFKAETLFKADNPVESPHGSVINISGGNFKSTATDAAGAYAIGNQCKLNISSGTYSLEPDEKYCVDGYSVKNKDGIFVVESANVASVNGKDYSTVNEAIQAASSGATITVLADVKEDIVIPSDKNIVLDLNGMTLTNVKDHTITNKGTLTIVDSSSGKTGTVDNITHARAAVFNDVDASANMNGGTFIRSFENGQNSSDNGGNSFYAVLNHGAMEINDGVKVIQDGHYSSLVENGWQNGGQKPAEAQNPSLTINGGYFYGGLNTIKNDEWATLEINGGDFLNATQHTVLNWNIASISGGTFESTASSAIYNANDESDSTAGKLTITGGSFKAPSNYYVVYNVKSSGAMVEISGGTYSSQYISNGAPEEYLADGFNPKPNSNGTYGVTETEVTVLPNTSFINMDTSELTEEQVKAVSAMLEYNKINIEGAGIDQAAEQVAGELEKDLGAQVEAARAAFDKAKELNADNFSEYSGTSPIYLYVRPYLDLKVMDVDMKNKVLTLDMEVMYALLASTAPDKEDVVPAAVAEQLGKTANAVIYDGGPEDETILAVQGPVVITLPLPDLFTSQNLTVKHTKDDGGVYYYKPEVDMAEKSITFENPHGFSEFKIYQSTADIDVSMEILGTDGKAENVDRTFYAAVFTDSAHKNRYGDVLAFIFRNSSKETVSVTVDVPGDGSSVDYYVTETDKNGNPIDESQDFGYQIKIKGGAVKLTVDGKEQVTITNQKMDQSSSSGKKHHSSNDTDNVNTGVVQPTSVTSAGTGDSTSVWPLVILFVLACAGLGGFWFYKKHSCGEKKK